MKYFILKKPLKQTNIFKQFNITPLRPVGEAFVLEYAKVMAPGADALDILQGDKNISIWNIFFLLLDCAKISIEIIHYSLGI